MVWFHKMTSLFLAKDTCHCTYVTWKTWQLRDHLSLFSYCTSLCGTYLLYYHMLGFHTFNIASYCSLQTVQSHSFLETRSILTTESAPFCTPIGMYFWQSFSMQQIICFNCEHAQSFVFLTIYISFNRKITDNFFF